RSSRASGSSPWPRSTSCSTPASAAEDAENGQPPAERRVAAERPAGAVPLQCDLDTGIATAVQVVDLAAHPDHDQPTAVGAVFARRLRPGRGAGVAADGDPEVRHLLRRSAKDDGSEVDGEELAGAIAAPAAEPVRRAADPHVRVRLAAETPRSLPADLRRARLARSRRRARRQDNRGGTDGEHECDPPHATILPR